MKHVISLILLSVLLSCVAEPEPIEYGKDACHTCKMTLMDKKFGAELVTQKGKVYKFDDINCMLTFYHATEDPLQEFKYKLVVDFTQPSKLIDARDAFYLKSPEIKSPMASQIAAFEKEKNMKNLKAEWNGIYMVWGELVTQFK